MGLERWPSTYCSCGFQHRWCADHTHTRTHTHSPQRPIIKCHKNVGQEGWLGLRAIAEALSSACSCHQAVHNHL